MPDPLEERDVHGDEPSVLVADGHEIGERVERVLELAAGPQHGVEQQDIFNRGRELPSHLVGALEQVDLRSGLEPHLFHHERAQRASASFQRNGHRRRGRARRRGAHRRNFGTLAAQRRPLRARARRPSGCAAPAPDRRHRKRRRGPPCGRADRAATPMCGRRRTGGSRRCRTSPAPRTASSTRRRARRPAAALEARTADRLSPLACARSSARVKACPTEAASRICCGDGSFSQPMTSTPIWVCICASGMSTAGSVPRYSCAAADNPRDIGDKPRFFVPEQRLGNQSGRPGIGRQAIDAEGRGGLERVAAAGELKNDGASALDGGHGMVMKHREQVTQPVRGREGLEQAGLA